jgi:hypothetical protein
LWICSGSKKWQRLYKPWFDKPWFARFAPGSDFTFISIQLSGLLQPIYQKVVERSRQYWPFFKPIDIF